MKVVITSYSYYVNGDRPVWRGIGYKEDGSRFIMDVCDDILMPRMYVVADDYDIFWDSIKSVGADGLIVKVEKDNRKSIYDEELYAVYVRLPAHVRTLRDLMPKDVKTCLSDVPWEKNVTYILGWDSPFFEIDDSAIDPLSPFIPLEHIHNSQDYIFPFKRRIAYWDIETDNSSGGINNDPFLRADMIPILSYVLIDPIQRTIYYYANSPDFTDSVEESTFQTEVPDDVLSLPNFSDYPREWNLIIKRFNRERDMHKSFIDDFAKIGFNEIVTFNGRGGNVHFRGKRVWINGYDMPMFFERCKSLGLYDYVQKLSPFPYRNHRRPNVYARIDEDSGKYEVFIRGVVQHDLYYDDKVLMYSRGERMQRHNLDTFLSYFLGMHKVDHTGLSVWDLFYKDWRKEMYYNIVDVEGLYALDVKLGYTNDVWMRSSMFNAKMEDVVYTAKIHDHITLMLTRDLYLLETRGNYRPVRYKGFVEYNKKIGGFNLDVKAGVYGYHEPQFGVILDFKSLYPSAIISLNAGPRTKIELDHFSIDSKGLWLVDYMGRKFHWNNVSRSINGGFFRKDIESIEIYIYTYLNSVRDGVKKRAHEYEDMYNESKDDKYAVLAHLYTNKEYAIKPMINGRFGTTGYEGSRMFDVVIFNTSTATGQYLIKRVIEYLDSNGYSVLLASTDSAFVLLDSKDGMEAFNDAKKLRDDINRMIGEIAEQEFNIYKNVFRIEIEKVFDTAIIINKRYYALNVIIKEDRGDVFVYDEPKLYIKGMEYVRRDSAKITDDLQINVINMIREGKSIDEIRNYLRRVDAEFETYPWGYICQRSGISGKISEGKGAKYDACRLANRILGKYYDAGSNPLSAKFVRHPSVFNGRQIPSGPITMAFDESDEPMLKKYGFVPDYVHLKKTVFYSKMDKIIGILTGQTTEEFIKKKVNLLEYL